jgi:hypothetical protein
MNQSWDQSPRNEMYEAGIELNHEVYNITLYEMEYHSLS